VGRSSEGNIMSDTAYLDGRGIKTSGAHYTPAELANFLAERALAHVPRRDGLIRILDPACGTGNLLWAVARCASAGLRRRLELIGYETDEVALDQARQQLASLNVAKCELYPEDFLEVAESHYLRAEPKGLFAVAPPQTANVDVVISNPPYVRTQVLGGGVPFEMHGLKD
jgi:adenine-specific DNA-methyltransferase